PRRSSGRRSLLGPPVHNQVPWYSKMVGLTHASTLVAARCSGRGSLRAGPSGMTPPLPHGWVTTPTPARSASYNCAPRSLLETGGALSCLTESETNDSCIASVG